MLKMRKDKNMKRAYLGIDVGSISTKGLLLMNIIR